MTNVLDLDGARIGGFVIKKVTSTQGTKEEDPGKISLVLEANKDEVNTGAYSFGDLLSALNIHQESRNPVTLRVLVPGVNTPA